MTRRAQILTAQIAPALVTLLATVATFGVASAQEPEPVKILENRRAFPEAPEIVLIDNEGDLAIFQGLSRKVPDDHPLRRKMEYLQPLQIDFEQKQVLAVCWGAHAREEQAWLNLDKYSLSKGSIRVRVRSLLRVGAPRKIPASWHPTTHPALMLEIPRRKKVLVEVVGARAAKRDFQPQRSERLVVTVAPDAMPLRKQIRLLKTLKTPPYERSEPLVLVLGRDDPERQLIDIGWSEFESKNNRLHVEAIEMRGDTLHVGVDAENCPVFLYSGPGSHRPRLRIDAPISKKVVVHVRRTGPKLRKDERDFVPFTKRKLSLTLDTSCCR